MAISLVSEMVRGIDVLSRGFMSAFFHKAEREEVAKEQLYMELNTGAKVGDTIFNFCCDIAS